MAFPLPVTNNHDSDNFLMKKIFGLVFILIFGVIGSV